MLVKQSEGFCASEMVKSKIYISLSQFLSTCGKCLPMNENRQRNDIINEHHETMEIKHKKSDSTQLTLTGHQNIKLQKYKP